MRTLQDFFRKENGHLNHPRPLILNSIHLAWSFVLFISQMLLYNFVLDLTFSLWSMCSCGCLQLYFHHSYLQSIYSDLFATGKSSRYNHSFKRSSLLWVSRKHTAVTPKSLILLENSLVFYTIENNWYLWAFRVLRLLYKFFNKKARMNMILFKTISKYYSMNMT